MAQQTNQLAARTYVRQIGVGERANFSIAGTFILIRTLAGRVKLDLNSLDVDMVRGDKIRVPSGFEEFAFLNEGTSPVSIEFIVGFGDFEESALDSQISLVVPEQYNAFPIVTASDTVPTLVAPQNADRVSLFIQNLSPDYEVRLTDSTGNAGLVLQRGLTFTLNSTGELYAMGIGGSAFLGVAEVANA